MSVSVQGRELEVGHVLSFCSTWSPQAEPPSRTTLYLFKNLSKSRCYRIDAEQRLLPPFRGGQAEQTSRKRRIQVEDVGKFNTKERISLVSRASYMDLSNANRELESRKISQAHVLCFRASSTAAIAKCSASKAGVVLFT